MSKWIIYFKLAIMAYNFLMVLRAKQATPELREAAIKKAFERTNAILPNSKLFTDDITEDEVSTLAEIAKKLKKAHDDWEVK